MKRLAGVLLFCGAATATLAQDPVYRERERLDLGAGQWTTQAPEPLGTPDGDLRRARELLIEGRPDAARRLLKRWIKANRGHDRYYEAVFLAGEAEFDDRDYYAAFENYEEVVANTAGELFSRALRREMDVARAFLSGAPRIVWKVLRLPAYDDGIEILDRIWERAPGTRLGEEALLLKADYYFEVGDAELAQIEYALLAEQFPNGRYQQVALLRSAESAERAFPGVKFDDRPLIDADDRYRQVEDRFPTYADRERVPARRVAIRDQRAAKELEVGDWYRKVGALGAAEFYYRAVLRDWPGTFAATEAQGRLLAIGAQSEPQERNP